MEEKNASMQNDDSRDDYSRYSLSRTLSGESLVFESDEELEFEGDISLVLTKSNSHSVISQTDLMSDESLASSDDDSTSSNEDLDVLPTSEQCDANNFICDCKNGKCVICNNPMTKKILPDFCKMDIKQITCGIGLSNEMNHLKKELRKTKPKKLRKGKKCTGLTKLFIKKSIRAPKSKAPKEQNKPIETDNSEDLNNELKRKAPQTKYDEINKYIRKKTNNFTRNSTSLDTWSRFTSYFSEYEINRMKLSSEQNTKENSWEHEVQREKIEKRPKLRKLFSYSSWLSNEDNYKLHDPNNK